jgi:hypothetical protein
LIKRFARSAHVLGRVISGRNLKGQIVQSDEIAEPPSQAWSISIRPLRAKGSE